MDAAAARAPRSPYGVPARGPVGRAVATAVGGVFAAGALVRRGKPIHTRGALLEAVVRRDGTTAGTAWEVPWLDEPGEDDALVRFSRAAGLPAPLPDVFGLALRFSGDGGRRHDLLLSSTVRTPAARFVLVPGTDPARRAYTCLLPYHGPRGRVLLGATPVEDRTAVGGLRVLAATAAARPVRFRLLAATPAGRWRGFGELEVRGPAAAEPDPPLAFDPVLNPMPGLAVPRWAALLREAAYAGARRGRGAPPPA